MLQQQGLQKRQHLDLDLEPVGETGREEVGFLDLEIITLRDIQQKLQLLEGCLCLEDQIQLQREAEIHLGLELISLLWLISFSHQDMVLEREQKQLR